METRSRIFETVKKWIYYIVLTPTGFSQWCLQVCVLFLSGVVMVVLPPTMNILPSFQKAAETIPGWILTLYGYDGYLWLVLAGITVLSTLVSMACLLINGRCRLFTRWRICFKPACETAEICEYLKRK